jgi:hypothetical protein
MADQVITDPLNDSAHFVRPQSHGRSCADITTIKSDVSYYGSFSSSRKYHAWTNRVLSERVV